MAADYSMYRYFNGEQNNPFNQENQNTAFLFWFYESVFENEFRKNEISSWCKFFEAYGLGFEFMQIISEDDYDRPNESKKSQIFDLWLIYLFRDKLFGEYGGVNWYKEMYFSETNSRF